MNLATFRSRIARVTGMSNSVTADQALMDGWVNEGILQFLRETKHNVKLAAMAVTAGQADYLLDTNILSLQGLWYEPADSVRGPLLEQVTPERIFEMRLPEFTDTSGSRYYALAGAHTLMLYPDPGDSDDLLHLLYVPRPTALSATSDAPSGTANGNIPEEYHTIIEAYAKWKAAEAEEHKGSDYGIQFQAEYERGIAKVKGDIRRKSGVIAPTVTIGRPRRVYPSPGVDLGY
jgi:hypothetical protein